MLLLSPTNFLLAAKTTKNKGNTITKKPKKSISRKKVFKKSGKQAARKLGQKHKKEK